MREPAQYPGEGGPLWHSLLAWAVIFALIFGASLVYQLFEAISSS